MLSTQVSKLQLLRFLNSTLLSAWYLGEYLGKASNYFTSKMFNLFSGSGHCRHWTNACTNTEHFIENYPNRSYYTFPQRFPICETHQCIQIASLLQLGSKLRSPISFPLESIFIWNLNHGFQNNFLNFFPSLHSSFLHVLQPSHTDPNPVGKKQDWSLGNNSEFQIMGPISSWFVLYLLI